MIMLPKTEKEQELLVLRINIIHITHRTCKDLTLVNDIGMVPVKLLLLRRLFSHMKKKIMLEIHLIVSSRKAQKYNKIIWGGGGGG